MKAYSNPNRESDPHALPDAGRMTIAKAKLYKTARLTDDIYDLYRAGEFVAVKYHGRGGYGLNFQIWIPGRETVTVGESVLENFVL